MAFTHLEVWWIFICSSCLDVCHTAPNDVLPIPQIDDLGNTIAIICTVECHKCGYAHPVPPKMVTKNIEEIIATKINR